MIADRNDDNGIKFPIVMANGLLHIVPGWMIRTILKLVGFERDK
jgi:hypothetical protein